MRNLSGGLQAILILTLIGSCAGPANTASRESNVSGDVSSLRQDVSRLEREIEGLRRNLSQRGLRPTN